jgi:hypothetical protein
MSDEYDNNKSYQAQSSEVMDGSTGSVNPRYRLCKTSRSW